MLDEAKQEINKLRESNNKLGRFSRRNNLRLTGIDENRKEDVEKVVKNILIERLSMSKVHIERAHQVRCKQLFNEMDFNVNNDI